MAAQYLTTSRLSNIINMISLGRQSGILRVIRGQGPTREIGQIKFLDGEPTTALLGQLTGQNALTVLANWGECVYSFDEQAIGDIDGDMLAAASGRAPSDPGRYVPSAPSSGSWPSYGYSSSYPTSYPASPPMGGGMASSSLPGYAQQGYGTPPSGYPAYDTPRGGYGPPAAPPPTATQLTPGQTPPVPPAPRMGRPLSQPPVPPPQRSRLLPSP